MTRPVKMLRLQDKSEIEAIIIRCQQNDRVAQRQLYMMFADELMSIAIRYAKDKSMARDLVHDTFIKVYEKIGAFQLNRGSFVGWMSRILINRAISDFRKHKRVLYQTEEVFDQACTEEVDIVQQLEAEDILQLLQILPEGGRLIFNMYIIEGYKHNEIAEILGISPSTSRSQLTRSKALLRQAITKRHSRFKRTGTK